MKIWHIFPVSALFISITVLFTGCGFLKHSETLDTSDSPINELVPHTEVTLESKTKNAEDMRSFLKTSYEKMQELAAADDAPFDGIKAEKAVEEQYADRLQELFTLDFSEMDEEKLDACLIEMTEFITIIRETRDALTLVEQ